MKSASRASLAQSQRSFGSTGRSLSHSGSARSINPLSNPKGTAHKCELCSKPAFIQCQCGVTFYCSEEHQALDWEGIHEKICALIAPLRAPAPVIGSEDERERRNQTLMDSKKVLIELTWNEASKYLVAGRFELAIPGAVQSLRLSLQVYGEGAIEIAHAYLLLAEANLGLGRHQQAEEFLSMANWGVLKNPDCSDSLKSKLHRNFGKLYAAQNLHAKALREFAQDVYFSSLGVGPEHIDTSGGYFQMALMFFAQNSAKHALGFYDKVVDIWYKFLMRIKAGEEDIESVGEAQLQEATMMLSTIAESREEHLGNQHLATAEAQYTLGLLHLAMGDTKAAVRCMEASEAVYSEQLGANHVSTRELQETLQQVRDAEVPQVGGAGGGAGAQDGEGEGKQEEEQDAAAVGEEKMGDD